MWPWGVSFLLVLVAGVSWARAVFAWRAERAALRLMRLTAKELRGVGIKLHGLSGVRAEPGLAVVAAQVFAAADTLQTHAPGTPAVLQEETIDLSEAIAEAVTAATATLLPGERHWRTPGRTVYLWADERALRHILGHVLNDAIRATREQDWIEISIADTPDGLAVIVQDEGAGFVAQDKPDPAPRDSRGISLRLVLARQLMLAHSGRLDIEAKPGVGARISLVFPATRLRHASPRMVARAESPA